MPWIKKDDCISCGVCVDECPTGAIALADDAASIDMTECIRCGKCHDVCPQDAVRHDSEKVGEEIEKNLQMTLDLMDYYDTPEDKKAFINRMGKHFNNQRVIVEKTIEKLDSLQL